MFQSATAIVSQALQKEARLVQANLPSIPNAARAVNRARDNLKPSHPEDLEFEVHIYKYIFIEEKYRLFEGCQLCEGIYVKWDKIQLFLYELICSV